MNRGAVERAIRFGLAVGATWRRAASSRARTTSTPTCPRATRSASTRSRWCRAARSEFYLGDEKQQSVRLTRAHLEEDAGKSLHEDFAASPASTSTAPARRCWRSSPSPTCARADEAVAYAKELHTLVGWIGICDGNMQEGSFRCDANVSVRKPGAPLGTRREIKNLNSFKFMQQAIDYEVRWQIDQIEDGRRSSRPPCCSTPTRGETRAMRTKEDAHDYRYFPDPDLPPLVIAPEWVERVKSEMPELPRVMAGRFVATTACPSTTPPR